MQRTRGGAVVRRALIVDSGLAESGSAATRRVRALISELNARKIEIIEALSCEDGRAVIASDSGVHCILLNWTQGDNDASTHEQATELLRAVRARNASVPIFLMASRKLAGTVSVEIAQLVDEFIWVLDDTAGFIGGRVQNAIERYIEDLLPPFAAALARYDREREYSWAAPGHQGGVAFLKSPIGRAFFEFYGENLFRTDMGIERGALGSMLGHTGPIGASERYAARVFGAHRSYTVLNGTSASNRAIMSACVGDNEIALCDRNCHKSIEQGLAITGGIPVFLSPTRNRYGIIGPIPPQRLEPKAIAKSIADNPLAKAAGQKRAVYSVLTNCTYDGMCYDAVGVEERLAKSVDRVHFDEAWYGYARFNPLYEGRLAMRGDPADHPKDGPTVFATHSTHKLLAALSQTSFVHMRDGRGAIDHGRFNEAYCSQASTSPLYALIASNEVAAAMMDGPAGQALTQETIDEAVACRLAVARVHQEFLAKKEWFFAPWNPAASGGAQGQAHPVPQGVGRAARDGPELLGAASRRELARLRRPAGRLVHARPDQVRHRLPGHEGRRPARQAGHPGRHRHGVSRPPRHRAVADHRSHGVVPVLDGRHERQVGHAAQHAARLQGGLRPQRAARGGLARHRRGRAAALRGQRPQGSRRRAVGAPAQEQTGPLAGAGVRHTARSRR